MEERLRQVELQVAEIRARADERANVFRQVQEAQTSTLNALQEAERETHAELYGIRIEMRELKETAQRIEAVVVRRQSNPGRSPKKRNGLSKLGVGGGVGGLVAGIIYILDWLLRRGGP